MLDMFRWKLVLKALSNFWSQKMHFIYGDYATTHMQWQAFQSHWCFKTGRRKQACHHHNKWPYKRVTEAQYITSSRVYHVVSVTSLPSRGFRFSQRYYWRSNSAGMWHRVDGQMAACLLFTQQPCVTQRSTRIISTLHWIHEGQHIIQHI
jgi:hypothetical protein